MKKIQFRFQFLVALIVLISALPISSTQAAPSLANYPTDPTADISWSAGESSVADVQSAFNNARTVENNQLGSSLPMMTLPDQSAWTAMSNGDQALWLINRERIDRGVMPLQGLESNVTSVAQTYADYLLTNNKWGHDADGRDPWGRLDANPKIQACHDFLGVAENLSVSVTSSSSIPLPLEKAVYGWMYDDSGSSWGHRHAILWYPYTDDNGPAGSEGFLGIGRAGGGPYQGPFPSSWPYAELIVMNIFDPCASYVVDASTTFADVPTTHPQYKYIQALWDAGLTGGCSTSPLKFCPDTVLDRAQSAVFMVRGALGSTYTPPPAPWPTFMLDNWAGFEYAQAWAEGMYTAGLTKGCQASPLMYCPATQLPRVEASVFGLRMKYGVNYTPPPATGTLLGDMTDATYWGAGWAEQAYTDGLLPSCGTLNGLPMFCPSELVNRGWGAYLIVKAKGLPTP